MYPNDNSLAFKNSKGLRWGEKSEKEKKQMEKQTNRLSYDKEVTKTKKKTLIVNGLGKEYGLHSLGHFVWSALKFFFNKSPVC